MQLNYFLQCYVSIFIVHMSDSVVQDNMLFIGCRKKQAELLFRASSMQSNDSVDSIHSPII